MVTHSSTVTEGEEAGSTVFIHQPPSLSSSAHTSPAHFLPLTLPSRLNHLLVLNHQDTADQKKSAYMLKGELQ